MAKTLRVRVKPKQYKTIKNLAERENITYSEAVERLIEDRNVILGDDIVDDIEDEGEGGGGLFLGVLLAAGFAFLNKYMNDNKETDK